MVKSNAAINLYIWLAITIAIFGIVAYYRTQINKKTANVNNMTSIYNKKATQLSTITDDDPTLNDKIFNYYVASSYNSCCAGEFQDSYVTVDALKEVIRAGARVLDFEIYSVDGKCVVAASAFDNEHLKGTYNSLPIETVMKVVNDNAFTNAPNKNDPLFLHFRIKSDREDVYEPLTNSIKTHFGPKLMEAMWGYEGRSGSNIDESRNLAFEPLMYIRNKVIIMASQKNNNFKKESNPFYELVNFGSDSLYFTSLRNHSVQYTSSVDEMRGLNKDRLTLTMPDWSEVNTNPPAMLHQSLGCQMVCMNYQNMDKNMRYYLDFFNENGYAFVLKPPELRYIVVELECPLPPDPALSYAARSYISAQGVPIIT